MEQKKIPEIRFEGYTDDWEQRKLDDMCSIITKQTGFDYSATIKPALVTEGREDTYSFIQNKDFDGENINLDTDFYIPIEVANKFPKITLDTPSLLISISGKIGNVGYYRLKKKAFIGGAVGICKLKKDNGSLLVYALQSDAGQAYFHSLIKASSHQNITVEDIRNITIMLPKSEDEYNKLSTYFKHLDHLITLHQRKYDKLVLLKKSMLEKMFPQNGSKIPEIRFNGFTEEWEKKKLSDVLERRQIIQQISEDAPRLAFAAGQGVIPLSERKTNNRDQLIADEATKKYLLTEYDDIVYNPANLKYGAIDRNKYGRGVISPIYVTFTTKEDPSFIEKIVTTEKFRIKALKYEEGTVVKRQSVSPENLLSFEEFIAPNKNEQKMIGAFFDNLDMLIKLQQKKIDKIKDVKKSLLDKMFV